MTPDYKARARALKKLGFIDYDLRRNLSSGQKARVSKLYASYSEIVEHPESFAKIRAGKKTRAAAKSSGIVASNTALYVPKGEFHTVKITHKKGVPVIKKISSEKASTQKLIHGQALLSELENIGRKRLPPNTWVTVKIGKNSPFKSVYRNPADLLKYITEIFRPGDEDADIEQLINNMSLVTYYGAIPENEKPPKRKRARGMTYREKMRGR